MLPYGTKGVPASPVSSATSSSSLSSSSSSSSTSYIHRFFVSVPELWSACESVVAWSRDPHLDGLFYFGLFLGGHGDDVLW
jgi:hypothetical protein